MWGQLPSAVRRAQLDSSSPEAPAILELKIDHRAPRQNPLLCYSFVELRALGGNDFDCSSARILESKTSAPCSDIF
jgi:hypothetical protein